MAGWTKHYLSSLEYTSESATTAISVRSCLYCAVLLATHDKPLSSRHSSVLFCSVLFRWPRASRGSWRPRVRFVSALVYVKVIFTVATYFLFQWYDYIKPDTTTVVRPRTVSNKKMLASGDLCSMIISYFYRRLKLPPLGIDNFIACNLCRFS